MFKAGVALTATLAALAVAPAFAAAKDSDHDGLPNSWEKGKTPSGLNLKALGADPKRRDVFMEIEYGKDVPRSQIACADLNALVGAFRSAPLKNPDGTTGIRLHIDAGKTCGSHDYDMGGSGTYSYAGGTPGCGDPYDMQHSLAKNRLSSFHAAYVASSICDPVEGYALDTDFMVRAQGNGNGQFLDYVMMHELGHVFGLSHGPFNGFSVMSGGLFRFKPGVSTSLLDYTRYPIHALDESNLDEHVGYETGSAQGDAYLAKLYGPQFCNQSLELQGPAHGGIDWNCGGAPFWMPPYDNYIDDAPVQYDVNGDGMIDTVPAVKPEWPQLVLGNGRIGG
jgi:hypothetical protein